MFKVIMLAVLLVVFMLRSDGAQAQSGSQSEVLNTEFESQTLGRVYQYRIYLPAGYAQSEQAYPVVYLLHGRGDTMAAWLNVRSTLDELIGNGTLPPVIVVMPDMPSSDRASYYVDSEYGGRLYRAEPVETAFFADLIPHIDSTYRTLADRASRIVGGYSMGGYGAIRYVLAHPDKFMGAIVLSPAVYTPLPPDDSSTREFGAFGSDVSLFDEEIYTRLNYPALLTTFSGEQRLHVFIAVGDDEWKHPNPADMEHDLDFEAHRFFNRVARVPGIASEFRVYDGGHDWDVWRPGFVEGMRYLANYLSTQPPDDRASGPQGWLTGTSGQDMAGGLDVDDDGSIYQALAVDGGLNDGLHAGGLDIAVVKSRADGVVQWTRQLGTSGNDRPYGLVVNAAREVVVVGYTQGDFADGGSAGGDDIIVFKLGPDGEMLWRTQIGTPAADRGYAVALADDNAIVISGYSKGDLAGSNAGDKDIITAKLSPDGEVLWLHQLGGDGEDKGQAVAIGPDGLIYSAGMTTSVLTSSAAGGIDGYVLALSPEGEQVDLVQFGTSEWDEVTGIAISEAGQIITAGFTAGDYAGALSGDKDIMVQVFNADFTPLAADQLGSNLNDKGAAVSLAADGSVWIAGYSDGAIGTNIGDFDVVLLHYDAAYARQSIWQIGTVERDGTDEWAEKNLFIVVYEDGVLLSGLTLGSFDDSPNNGGSDVFLLLPDVDLPPD